MQINFTIPHYSTVRYEKHSGLLGTWAHTFDPDYPQVINSDPRWTILDGTSERKT